MKNKLPVLLAITVTSQCAPLLVTEVNGEDVNSAETEMIRLEEDGTLPQKEEDYIDELLTSEKRYVNHDTVLLCSADLTAASTASVQKRDAVFVLEESGSDLYVIDTDGNAGWIQADNLNTNLAEIFDEADITMYVNADDVSVYDKPDENSTVISTLSTNDAVHVTGTSPDAFARIETDGTAAYIKHDDLSDHKITFASQLASIQTQPVTYSWSGARLSAFNGSVTGPSGKETYYNLNMSAVISVMRSMGFNEADYPYWVRSDGAKMLGPYVMVAADLSAHPRGTTMAVSLGTGLVCDTGSFATNGSGTAVDVAAAW